MLAFSGSEWVMVGGDGFLEEEEGVGYGLMGGCGWSWIACIRLWVLDRLPGL